MTLAYDIYRCLGELQGDTCPRRETCQRYIDRDKTGDWTPFVAWACAGEDEYIEAKP